MSASFGFKQTDLGTLRTFIGMWTYSTDGEFTINSGNASAEDMTILIATSAGDIGTGCQMDFNDVNMTAGSWFHVVVVFDGSLTGNANRLKVWVNNVAKTLTVGGGAVPATLLDGGATLFLGKFGGILNRFYNGAMDLVGLWNRALTAGEVATLYSGGAGLVYPFTPTAKASRFRNSIRIGIG